MQFSNLRRTGVFAISLLTLVGFQYAAASQDEPGASEKHGHDGHEYSHTHSHAHTHKHDEDIDAGYFEDSQVEDRALSDWEGDWQSVYPYLKDGTLDEVFIYKEEKGGNKTAEEYKKYYEQGYQTEVDRIVIQGDVVSFHEDGEEISGEYSYDGYEILTYEAGNRGVRYIFELKEGDGKLPRFIQFSDHSIFPTKADHFHLYWGDNRAALLEEVINWPTYYPSEMSGHDIAHEMMAH